MRGVFRKHLSALRPVDDAGEKILSRIKNEDLVMVDVKRLRNVRFHRLYFALINLVWRNLDEKRAEIYPTPEVLHEAVKFAVGLREMRQSINGEIYYVTGSIAFHKMDDHNFSIFFDRVADLFVKHFLPGLTSEELKAEIYEMVGIQERAA